MNWRNLFRGSTEVQRFDPWTSFTYNGNTYPVLGPQFTMQPQRVEEVDPTYAGYARLAYHSSAPVFALMLARASLFSEARFQWRQFRNGSPGPLFGNQELELLENPWPNATTGDLLVRLIQDYDLTGNFYGRVHQDGIDPLRPDWVTIVVGSNIDTDNPAAAIDARVAGYVYHPGGRNSGETAVPLLVEEVCHFTGPTPDPMARFRGMSWLTSIMREVYADQAATQHKLKFFEGGATPNLAVSVDIPDPDDFFEFVRRYREEGEGVANAYKTLFFNTGTSFQTVGTDLEQLDFKVTQGAGESRIAAAAGVPPVIVGFSEGLEAATYSNYALAMRRFADLTMRPLWRMAAGCLQSVLEVPPGAELWYDDRDIPALKDDIVNRAEVQNKQANAAKMFADGGWEPDSIIDALDSDDLSRLVHSGLPTVQVQAPTAALPIQNGKSPAALEPAAAEPAERSSVIRELETALEEAQP